MHSKPKDLVTDSFEWGSIKWGVSPDLEAGASLTTGEVVINPTKGHDRHNHPDSDEVLYIIEGEGVQTVGDEPPTESVKRSLPFEIPSASNIPRSGSLKGLSPRESCCTRSLSTSNPTTVWPR